MTCPYCDAPVHYQDSALVYGRSFGYVYVCSRFPTCDAFVGAHKTTGLPLGRLADAGLRILKKAAHAKFNPLWSYKQQHLGVSDARSQGYRWLAHRLGLSEEECHIGMFDAVDCQRVIQLCDDVYASTPILQEYFFTYHDK